MADVIIDLGSLTAEQGFTILGDTVVDIETGNPVGFSLGRSVSEAGDVNGDGFADIIIGAPGGGDGQAYVVYGRAGGTRPNIDLANLSPTDGFVIRGDSYGYGDAGLSVAGGDINGDGISDLIVASPSRGATEISPNGTIYVIYGVLGATRPDVDLGSLGANEGFEITGESSYDEAGHSVAAAGDFNGDGVGDLIIGAPAAEIGGDTQFTGQSAGKAYVIFGTQGTGRSDIDLGSLSSADGFVLEYLGGGNNTPLLTYEGVQLGYSVAGAGDVNGDGFDDVLIGAPGYDFVPSSGPYAANSGRVYLVLGRDSIPTSNIESAADISYLSTRAGGRFGHSVSGAGDFNDNGTPDVIFSSPFGQNSPGLESFVGLDENGAPFFSLVDGGGQRIGISVSSAGDVNGDGIDDIIFGEPYGPAAAGFTGLAYVIFGGPSAQLTLDPTAQQGFVIEGAAVGDRTGFSVSAAGDLNNDGFDDLIVGAPYRDVGGIDAGAAYVIYGFANNRPPDAVDDTKSTDEDTPITISVLANDSDPDGDAIVITGTPTISQGLGTVSVVNDQLVYNPSPAYNSLALGATATVVIDYTIADPSGETDTGQAIVTVTGVNDAPVVPPAKSVTTEQNKASVTVTIGATDVDGDTLTYSTATGPAQGSVSFNQANGTFTFTPTGGFVGFDAFTVLVSDGKGGSGTVAVDVTVFPPQPGPPPIDNPVPQGGSLNPTPGDTHLGINGFGTDAAAGGWASNNVYLRRVGDVNGDNRADIVGFGSDVAYVSLGIGNGTFANPIVGINAFGASVASGGWSNNDLYHREVADVNGDGRDDIVGFGSDVTYVSLGQANGTFANPIVGINSFGASVAGGGWVSDNLYPRQLGDVNGDGRADIVGFGSDSTFVSLGQANGTFANPFVAIAGFGASAAGGGWTSQDGYTRRLGDVNGDGRADIVGFGSDQVYVSLANVGGTFANPVAVGPVFSAANGWPSDSTHHRELADLNADGRADIVGFGPGGTYGALALPGGTGFSAAALMLDSFGANTDAGGWANNDLYPRAMADLDADNRADIIGFGGAGVFTAINTTDFFVI